MVINKVGVDSDICVRASLPSLRGMESLKYANNDTPRAKGYAVWLTLNCLFLKYMPLRPVFNLLAVNVFIKLLEPTDS